MMMYLVCCSSPYSLLQIPAYTHSRTHAVTAATRWHFLDIIRTEYEHYVVGILHIYTHSQAVSAQCDLVHCMGKKFTRVLRFLCFFFILFYFSASILLLIKAVLHASLPERQKQNTTMRYRSFIFKHQIRYAHT